MNDWEQDADAWKKTGREDDTEDDETKPWKEADGWKLEGIEAKRNPKIRRFLEVTMGIRPTVPTMQVERASDITVKDRDALKLVVTLSSGQRATTEEGELFLFSSKRYMWIRIPWEIC